MSDWGVALIAAGSAIAGSVVTGWLTRSAGFRQAAAAQLAGEEQAAAARLAGEQQAQAVLKTVQQTLEAQARTQQLETKREVYVAFLQAAQALVEDRKRAQGALDEALLAEAQRTYQVLRLEGPDNVTAHAQFLMQAIDDSLADRSVGVAEIEHFLYNYVTVAQRHLLEPWGWMGRSRSYWIAGGTTEPPATAP
ncbi:hypothetical protein SAMN06272775_0102 [Streptomyces sp. 2323.1]|uniref:PspA/IM30 family protein n=1 Tax=Streptomyces sp. 2323.1 TaxID=1938841 RepID=UPI000BBFBBDD|nr:hypothetical protein [Streptomyces sp. 2323.1]SOE09024.1 hypothetical protein SAMN06272775_0102 [Streptomyces sp. 2323.1]